ARSSRLPVRGRARAAGASARAGARYGRDGSSGLHRRELWPEQGSSSRVFQPPERANCLSSVSTVARMFSESELLRPAKSGLAQPGDRGSRLRGDTSSQAELPLLGQAVGPTSLDRRLAADGRLASRQTRGSLGLCLRFADVAARLWLPGARLGAALWRASGAV